MVEPKKLAAQLRRSLDSCIEWLAVYPEGRTFPMRSDEIEIEDSNGRLIAGMPGEKGFRRFRVLNVTTEGDELLIEASGPFGGARTDFRLIARTPASELSSNIELARLTRANEIAAMMTASFPTLRLRRVALNDGSGRIAQLTFEDEHRKQSIAIADVTNTITPESLLASAFLRLDRVNSRRRNPVENLWLLAEKRRSRPVCKLHGLLESRSQARVRIVEIPEINEASDLRAMQPVGIGSLRSERISPLKLPDAIETSSLAEMIIEVAPGQIDRVWSKQGETLRFYGLPFARVRKVLGEEKAWFGVGERRRALTVGNFREVETLISELGFFRSPDQPNPRHEYYRASPESWLESILRRNIRMLDHNLILSPIYNQFRTQSDKIDLLALRKDGRLVIIELKTSPDREMVFQAADYWRKIELHRRRGNLSEARLFGARDILDKPALIYAVAPALSFHRDFEYFARMLAPEIDLWRFELHEDWRREIKVISRRDYRHHSTGFTNR